MRLAEYITLRLEAHFQWGANDCMTFAIGWLELSTGKRLLPRPLWQTELQAARVMKKYGGLQAALDAHFTSIPPSCAKDGDIALCAGVVSLFSGAYIVAPGATGLVFKPRTEAEHAWTV